MMAGEKFGVRVPGARPVQHRNRAPMFYTAWEPLTMMSRNPQKQQTLNQAMQERFKTRAWTRPLPAQGRIPNFPKCGPCFAAFILQHAVAEQVVAQP